MNPHEILTALWQAGVLVRLAPDGVNLAVSAGRLTLPQRELLVANKSELIALLVEAHTTTRLLIAAAMRRCDQFNDGVAARAEMRRDCLALPPSLQVDALEHFENRHAVFLQPSDKDSSSRRSSK